LAPARPKAPTRSAQPDQPTVIEADEDFDDEPVFDDEVLVPADESGSTASN